jgi:hypothetical protein
LHDNLVEVGMWLRAIAVWLLLLVIAIVNGAVREGVLRPAFGTRVAHVVSTLSLSVLILAAAWMTAPFVRYESAASAFAVGVVWLALTLAFEFLAGRFVFGKTWEVLLADYDVMQGRIWPLVLVVTLFAPLAVLAFSRRPG